MQVSAAAATDVGGGDRFDSAENRALGRAYLQLLYQRYRNWPDAIAAYNWGIGRLNAWLYAGRPVAKLAKGVAAYTDRVLRDSGVCNAGPPATLGRLGKRRVAARLRFRTAGAARAEDNQIGPVACTIVPAGAAGFAVDGTRWRNDNRLLVGLLPEGFLGEVDAVIRQTERDLQRVEQR
jgi:Transglycosylase SLT domain